MSEWLARKDAVGDVPIGRREIVVDDAETRVTKWAFEPGQGTGWHRHALPYLVVPQTGGELTLERDDGTRTLVTYRPGAATKWSDVPFVHHAVNTGTERVELLEIEFKAAG